MEKPLSLEHWIDSLNTVLLVASAIELAGAAGAGSTGGAGSAAKPAAPAGKLDVDYAPPLGGGGITDCLNFGNKTITIGHGGRHLEGTGLSVSEVNQTIARHVANVHPGTGQFYKGQVTVKDVIIEYTSYGVEDGIINVGTYYVK